jgi:hypothetical protein
MLNRARAIVLGLGAALLVGCGRAPGPGTLNDSMTQVIAPSAQTIWDITNRATAAKGDALDASMISPTDWAELEGAGVRLRNGALMLADGHHVRVAGLGQAIMGEDAAGVRGRPPRPGDPTTAKQVQAWIDADPATFAQRARRLAQSGRTIVTASHARDVRTLYEVTSALDEVCDGCHERFWGTDEPPPLPR